MLYSVLSCFDVIRFLAKLTIYKVVILSHSELRRVAVVDLVVVVVVVEVRSCF